MRNVFNVRSSIFCSLQAGKKQLVLFAVLSIEFVMHVIHVSYSTWNSNLLVLCKLRVRYIYFFQFPTKIWVWASLKDQHKLKRSAFNLLHLGDNVSIKGMKIQQKNLTNYLYHTVLFFTGKYYIDYLSFPTLTLHIFGRL